MALYMWTGSYTTDAIRGMVDDPQDREALAVRRSSHSAESCTIFCSASETRISLHSWSLTMMLT